MSLEEIPDAIRYDDPLTESAGTGSDPATELWISQPDRLETASDARD